MGDSLTVGSTFPGGFIGSSERAGLTATVDAKVGRSTPTGTRILSSRAGAGLLEPLVLVALGTNDVAFGISTLRAESLITQVLSAVGPGRTIVWINLRLRRQDRAQPFNDALTRLAAVHPNLRVADWASNPASTQLAPDGVHLSTSGYRARAAFMVDALLRLPCS
jgi:lysophospholipase L1-like esterase